MPAAREDRRGRRSGRRGELELEPDLHVVADPARIRPFTPAYTVVQTVDGRTAREHGVPTVGLRGEAERQRDVAGHVANGQLATRLELPVRSPPETGRLEMGGRPATGREEVVAGEGLIAVLVLRIRRPGDDIDDEAAAAQGAGGESDPPPEPFEH